MSAKEENAKDTPAEGSNGAGSSTTADAPADAGTAAAEGKEDKTAQLAKLMAEGKKASALRQWEDAVEKYATALEIQDELGVGELDPAKAPFLFNYGRALFELALSQQGVMGKEEVARGTDPSAQADAGGEAGPSGKFVFEGDGDDDDEDDEEGGEEGEEGEAQGEEGEGQEGAGADGDEPEDDFNAAWEVLDVARTIYEREIPKKTGAAQREDRLALAECYLHLGDISCETEKFDQAVSDYKSALEIKKELLPPSSRALASAHYQLSSALELTPGGRPAALEHVQAALDGFKARAAELRAAGEGKGVDNPDVGKLSDRERESELKDVTALITDLEVKIDELKAAPEREDLVSESINHLLGGVGGAAAPQDAGPVNDLTSMVRKKKKPAAAAAAPAAADEKKPEVKPAPNKREAEDVVAPDSKKVKLDDGK